MKGTLTALFILLSINLFSQKKQFEGIVKFSVDYQSENTQFDLKQPRTYFGDSYVSYIKPGLYRQDYNNSRGISYVIYNYKTNRYYYKLKNIDTLYFYDCSKETHDFNIERTDSIIKILNHDCNSVKVTSSSYTSQYFFAKDLYNEPSFFRDHKMGGYNLITEASESIYLKIVSDFGAFKTIIQAQSIVKKRIKNKIFKLPDLPIKER